jgi:ferredoxin
MALRKMVRIDEALCDGCGDCLRSCAEGALQLVDGKARLVSDVYCDGLGACLGECPQGAISIEEREAAPFDEAEVERRKRTLRTGLRVLGAPDGAGPQASGCPGSALRTLSPGGPRPVPAGPGSASPGASQLGHWPVQLRLVPAGAPFLAGADVVVCADCVPFAVPDFHARYLSGRAVVVGCPKLDDPGDMMARLQALVSRGRPRRITVLRMEVPCCAGIADAALQASSQDGLDFPVEEHVVGVGGGIVERRLR